MPYNATSILMMMVCSIQTVILSIFNVACDTAFLVCLPETLPLLCTIWFFCSLNDNANKNILAQNDFKNGLYNGNRNFSLKWNTNKWSCPFTKVSKKKSFHSLLFTQQDPPLQKQDTESFEYRNTQYYLYRLLSCLDLIDLSIKLHLSI